MSQSPHLFKIIAATLLRPRRFADYLAGGRRNLVWTALAALTTLVGALGLLVLGIGSLLSLRPTEMIASLCFAITIPIAIAGICTMISADRRLGPLRNGAFWMLRNLLAMTPPLTLVLALVLNDARAQPPLLHAPHISIGCMLGVLVGGVVTVILARHKCRDEANAARWLITGGALVIGGALWQSYTLHPACVALSPAFIGFAVGVLRPLSYLWAALLSVTLVVAVRTGVCVRSIRQWHPVSYDDLSLPPLPGLRGLLVRACAVDSDAGCDWLLDVARHPGQHRAAERAILAAGQDRRMAHPLLLRLSTRSDGAALLRGIVERSAQPHPLVAAYAALAHVESPEAWPTEIKRRRVLLVACQDWPSATSLAILLDLSLAVLQSTRWSAARERLLAAPHCADVADPISRALLQLRSLATNDALERGAAITAFPSASCGLTGWPSDLLATIYEHIHFLLAVERRRLDDKQRQFLMA